MTYRFRMGNVSQRRAIGEMCTHVRGFSTIDITQLHKYITTLDHSLFSQKKCRVRGKLSLDKAE
jgi:hypothetical protein